MPAEDHTQALIITFSCYSCILIGLGYWAYRRESALKANVDTDEMTAHYLAGRSFGSIMSAATIFASLFNGFSIIGAPSESFYRGWFSFTWILSTLGMISGFCATVPRLRCASEIRDHQSPADFVTDRFQSQVLRYTLVLLQVTPTLIFLATQIIAIKLASNQVFLLDPENPWPSVIITAVIVVFEWAGGLNSVAMTDTLQGVVIFLSYIALPIAIYVNFGGWDDLEPETFPRPDFYQTMTKYDQMQFWQFALVNVAFFSMPTLIQRTYAASHVGALKFANAVLLVGGWLAVFVGVFAGIMAVQVMGPGAFPPSPFNAILDTLMDLGGFPKATAVIINTAFLAAVMSTIDSLIISASQLIVGEIVIPTLRGCGAGEDSHSLTMIGRVVSFVVAASALCWGLFWDSGPFALLELLFGVVLQTCPAFFIGLYSKYEVHPWSIATAGLIGGTWVFVFHYQYIDAVENPKPISPGVSGFALNLTIIALLELIRLVVYPSHVDRSIEPRTDSQSIESVDGESKEPRLVFPDRPAWDVPYLAKFGDKPLTWRFLYKKMSGTYESATNPYWIVLMLVSSAASLPLYPASQPPLNADFTFSIPPITRRGMPWWAFQTLILMIVPSILLAIEIYRMPEEFGPEKEDHEIFSDVPKPNAEEVALLKNQTNITKQLTVDSFSQDDSDPGSPSSPGRKADAYSLTMQQVDKDNGVEHR